MNSINLEGFTNIKDILIKAYEEGVYADTSENRKLNRVGQKYSVSSSNIKNIINKVEEDILKETNNEYETCCILGKNGEVIAKLGGKKDHIDLTPVTDKIKDTNVFTHNHPASRCFSIQDLNIAIRFNIKQMRAIAPKSIKGNGTWVFEKGDLTKEELNDFTNAYNYFNKQITNILSDKVSECGFDNIDIVTKECNLSHHYLLLENMINKKNYYFTPEYWSKKGVKFYFEPK